MTTPDLQLRTLYVLDDEGRMVTTREPGANRPPAFALIRGVTSCVWALRNDVPLEIAGELNRIASSERVGAAEDDPLHAGRYQALVGGRVESGPAYSFPDTAGEVGNSVILDDTKPLERGFAELVDEMDGRSPIAAVIERGQAVSVCHCARRSDEAAEAGLFTLESHRGRGYGRMVTVAWARAISESGRMPLYSTSWDNPASRSVARKLGLQMYATDWSMWDA